MISLTKDFSSLEGIDLEVYAGVDNIIHIDVSDDDGQRIQLEGGTINVPTITDASDNTDSAASTKFVQAAIAAALAAKGL